MTSHSHSGVVTAPGKHPVEQTVEKIEQALRSKGLKLFAAIDHSGEAEQVGLHLRPTKLLIFGSAMAGTALMAASPTSAIDLPLKILIWADDEGTTQISYNSTAYLEARHNLPQELTRKIAAVEWLVAMAAE
ncbi:MAG: DUF302 domain-containing protein [Acidobacteria bacterium]|nr:DUF302 domain-containing protein [Acidobacteriota bacterium]